jgi:putative transposase
MMSVLMSVLATLQGAMQSRATLHLEVLALRHQLQVLQRSQPRRLRLAHADRWLWAWLSHVWGGWRTALVIVQPETVVAWHRNGFRRFWTWRSRRRTGRPPVSSDARVLIRRMAHENPLWGAPRIHGELRKLGVQVSQATVAKYMARPTTPPSQSWRTFLANHVQQIAAADFFVVPTATYRLLFVLVILAHERRQVVHVAVTRHPTAAWAAQQLREAFPWDQTPGYLIHDRDLAFEGLMATAKAMGIHDVRTAPRSPWQNAYVERFIGSIRRECLDHVIVLNAAGLRTVLKSYLAYYTNARTHLSLDKDAPQARPVVLSAMGPSPPSRRSAACIIGTSDALHS